MLPALDPVLPAGHTLRPMLPSDLPVVHALERRLFPEDAWPMAFFEEELAHAGPAQRGGTRDYRVIVTEVPAGTVVGYCGLMCVPPLADVQTIAVVPEAEGLGLGTAMLRWMTAEATRRGADDLLLEVRADNVRAQELYVRHGFDHIHTRAGYYPGAPGTARVDALIMRRHLLSV